MKMSSFARLSWRLYAVPVRLMNTTAAGSATNARRRVVTLATAGACTVGGGVALYAASRMWKLDAASDAKKSKKNGHKPTISRPHYREQRFIKFASVEYDGQVFMTPQDFLESVLDQEPRPRLKRRQLTDAEVAAFRDSTPSLQAGSSLLFRTVRDRGLISYTEYLFLLSVLIKPRSGFLIAFNMFDMDGNKRVDKSEFLIIEDIFSKTWKGSSERLRKANGNTFQRRQQNHTDSDGSPQKPQPVDTLLTVHFFGKTGKGVLQYADFEKFMENLQKEIVELEFHEFSKGGDRITEMDFGKILLRYTYLESEQCQEYLERLLHRLKEEKGIGFDEFWAFCQFLNNIDDFTVAVNLFNLSGRPVSEHEFYRAVRICGGAGVSRHLVHTVFQLFDVDGDGKLSHREFVAIMKDRLRRRFKAKPSKEMWDNFRSCVKNEMKSLM